ncbi:hypothetical protein [Streptomyces sp. MST-110588]|uniref:hypothetical protein n=1 Tax=Streptomyces sp. MST-110588 TaxID=2833628 RepID=UPI001F5C97E4|nr:hypothetical protein [Streptomyces sp. MST-110588]UNO40413.1 hypothetical protein KGS77_13530 [Streptomyces sp. MST-110588]
MTAFSSWGQGRRAAAAIGAVTIGLLTLSACEKPTPMATVTVGKDTVTAEAACYDNGDVLGNPAKDKKAQAKFEECLTAAPKKTITVHPGEKVRIGVDPDMADQGWFALTSSARLNNLSKQTYASFAGDDLFVNQQTRSLNKNTVISVVTSNSDGGYTGVWNIKLERAES